MIYVKIIPLQAIMPIIGGEMRMLGGLGLTVIDELHLLSDGERGALLEINLLKVLWRAFGTRILNEYLG